MGSKRKKVFELNDEEFFFDFGNYALLMYYAKQLDAIRGKRLFDATQSEYYYRVNYDLPLGSLTDADEEAHFNVPDIEDVVEFLQNTMIPALYDEVTDLMVRYGGATNFVELYYINPGYLTFIGFNNDERFEGDASQLSYLLTRFKDFLKYCLDLNQPYKVYVD